MNCGDASELAPLYLSGKLEPARAAVFAAHLQSCAACAAAVDRRRSRGARRRARWLAIAASVAIVVLGAALLARRTFRVPLLYAEVLADHRQEVIERQPRQWQTDAAGIASLAEREGVPSPVLQALGRDGYLLEKAKVCQLEGRRYLHLVYTHGADEISAYVRRRQAPGIGPLATADVGALHLAVINGAHVTALFVADRADDVLSRARAITPVL